MAAFSGVTQGRLGRRYVDDWLARIERHAAPLRHLGQAIDPLSIWRALVDHTDGIAERATRRLGPALALDLDRCHVRHGDPAHLWHQDGALGFDFLALPVPPPDALLTMITCWIALTPCGEDAPGLEWIDGPQERLLTLPELDPQAVAARHSPPSFVRPSLAAGDVLVFGGDLLHRTHRTPAMSQRRTSIELRLFPAHALPRRLAGDRFLRVS